MYRKMIKLMIGFISGHLYIIWLPIQFPLSLSELLVEFVFHPVYFMAAMAVFMIGFILHSEFIMSGVKLTITLFKMEKINVLDLMVSYCVLISFYILLHIGFWQTILFFCFSVIYGMISRDLKGEKFT